MNPLQLLQHPTRHLFFTGKGGVGKTSLSTACAIALADSGKQVLLVSTDAASNLDEMLGITLANTAVPVPGVPGLSVLNIDPDNAAQSYRARVLAQMDPASTEAERSQVQEQLSGACTTEIAAFDEFAHLLSGDAASYDHVVFDTAPTGHSLLLMDATEAYHRQMLREYGDANPGHLVTPLMRLQDPTTQKSCWSPCPKSPRCRKRPRCRTTCAAPRLSPTLGSSTKVWPLPAPAIRCWRHDWPGKKNR